MGSGLRPPDGPGMTIAAEIALQHELRLSNEGDEAALRCRDARLPDHRPPAAMYRRRLPDDPRPDRRRCDEIGLALDCRGPGALRQVDDGARGAERIGERHDRAAVKDCGNRAQLFSHRHLRDDFLGRGAGEFDAQELGKRQLGSADSLKMIQLSSPL